MINDANLVRISEPLIRDAKDLCARSEHTVCSALQQLNGWSSSQLMAALGESFGYPVLDMPSLQKTRPNFRLQTSKKEPRVRTSRRQDLVCEIILFPMSNPRVFGPFLFSRHFPRPSRIFLSEVVSA